MSVIQGMNQRTTLASLSLCQKDEQLDEGNVVKPVRRFKAFPALSINIEPHPKSGDPEVKIIDLNSGTPIATNHEQAQKYSIESISRKLQSGEGLKAALDSALWGEPAHTNNGNLRKSSKADPDFKGMVNDRRGLEDNHKKEWTPENLTPITDHMVEKEDNLHVEKPLQNEYVGTDQFASDNRLDTGDVRNEIMDSSHTVEKENRLNKDHMQTGSRANGVVKNEPERADNGDLLKTEPIRLPKENTFSGLIKARDEELLRLLKESNTLHISSSLGPSEHLGGCNLNCSDEGTKVEVDQHDGKSAQETVCEIGSNELTLVQPEAKVLSLAPESCHKSVEAFHLAGLGSTSTSLSPFNIASIAPLSSSTVKCHAMSDDLASEAYPWSTCLIHSTNDIKGHIFILKTNHEADVLWGQAKIHSFLWLLQFLAFIFVVLWSGFFEFLIFLPPT